MPFRTFADAEVLTAAWVNDYLMEQATVICTSGTRPSGVGAPIEGMTIFETDTDRFLIYNGSAWIRVGSVSSAGWTGCHVQRAATQTIPNVTATAISWDSEVTDTDGFITAPSGTITIPAGLGGVYGITVATNLSAGAGSLGAYVSIQVPAQEIVVHMGANASIGSASAFWSLGATNTVSANVYQTSGASLAVTAQLQLWRVTA